MERGDPIDRQSLDSLDLGDDMADVTLENEPSLRPLVGKTIADCIENPPDASEHQRDGFCFQRLAKTDVERMNEHAKRGVSFSFEMRGGTLRTGDAWNVSHFEALGTMFQNLMVNAGHMLRGDPAFEAVKGNLKHGVLYPKVQVARLDSEGNQIDMPWLGSAPQKTNARGVERQVAPPLNMLQTSELILEASNDMRQELRDMPLREGEDRPVGSDDLELDPLVDRIHALRMTMFIPIEASDDMKNQ